MRSMARAAAVIASTLAWLPWLPLLLLPSAVHGQQSSDTSTSCEAPADPRGVGVHANGALYVLDTGIGILEYNNGVLVGIFAETEAEGGLVVSGDSILVSPASATSGTVEAYDFDATLEGTFPAASSDHEAIPGGYAVAIDATGDVYVSNFLQDGVEVYDGATGEYLRQILEDTRALGIAFGPDGLLYAAINGDDEVRRFQISADGNSTLVEAFISGGSGTNTRVGPWGIAVNQDDYLIYVCWAGSKELTEYSQSGAEMKWWVPGQDTSATFASGTSDDTNKAAGGGVALSPWYVNVDDAGDVYVTATDEDGVETDVLKYDGVTGDEIGRASDCFGGSTSDFSVPSGSVDPTAAPSTLPSGASIETTASPLTTGSPAGTPNPSVNPTPLPSTASPLVNLTPPPSTATTMPSGTSPGPSTAPPSSLEPTTAPMAATFSPLLAGETRSPATTVSPVSREIETETPAPIAETSAGSTASPAPTLTSSNAETENPVGEGEAASNGAGPALRLSGFAVLAAVLSGAISPFLCMV